MIDPAKITCVVLAGGMARRMGGIDKGLITLAGQPLIKYVVDKLAPQTGHLIINANRNCAVYRSYAREVITDIIEDYQGPLAGIYSAMRAARTPYLMVVPCDSPFVPDDLVVRLSAGLEQTDADISIVVTNGRLQPVFALIMCKLAQDLKDFLARGGRKIDVWYARHRMTTVDFSTTKSAFQNINTPDECNAAETLIDAVRHV